MIDRDCALVAFFGPALATTVALGSTGWIGCAPARVPAHGGQIEESSSTTTAALVSRRQEDPGSGAPTTAPTTAAPTTTAAVKTATIGSDATGAAPSGDITALDPLALGALEDNAPKTVVTPTKSLRTLSRADLSAALAMGQRQSSVDAAVAAIKKRIGAPKWVEENRHFVWIAPAGGSCHRLVVDANGSLDIDTMPTTEWTSLTALTQRNECSGETRRSPN